MNISLPYGRSGLQAKLTQTNIQSATSTKWDVEPDTLDSAIRQPIGLKLSELAKESRSAVIVTCDKTRGVPSNLTIPLVLEELKKGGIHHDQVKVLVAKGLHKGETMSDIRERFGDKLTSTLHFEIHDSDNERALTDLGELPSGIPLQLNRTVAESQLVIMESTVEPHFFAGFTGGSKVILPGVAGTETVMQNHCPKNIDDPKCRYGVLENPIRDDANQALKHLQKTFAINLILDIQKRIVHATAGEPEPSFNAAAKTVLKHSSITVNPTPDIIITTNGGYPLDRNLYQCVKGIAAPENILHSKSKIIMLGECADGVAHKDFLELLSNYPPSELYTKIKNREIVTKDIWQAQVLCRILSKTQVSFVTRPQLKEQIRSIHMNFAASVEEALQTIDPSGNQTILIAPEGPSTILQTT